jgi:hypothetical protein
MTTVTGEAPALFPPEMGRLPRRFWIPGLEPDHRLMSDQASV